MFSDNTVLPVVEVLRVCSETNVLKFIVNVWYRIFQFKTTLNLYKSKELFSVHPHDWLCFSVAERFSFPSLSESFCLFSIALCPLLLHLSFMFCVFLSSFRPGQPAAVSFVSVPIVLSVALLRGPGHPVYSPVCGIVPAGFRLQH